MSHPSVQTASESQIDYQFRCAGLPLGVYREVASHLRQVVGVETGLASPTNAQFDYYQSQVGHLWLRYTENASVASRQQVDRILSYYSDRFGGWQTVC
ncbi:hypothetical protein [Geitlerinema sp. PCC 9228]|jgi:hypothetical protein|uniref:hypothetical protein n=1 Tax=Geitlerinema sp. PCC 9228 TaxID=111611 RepID=UPI0008F9D0AA|nr:hypothetical protein [Geitlerinema sp. PCC 9228]